MQTSANYQYMLPIAVACSFSGGISMRYVQCTSGLMDDVISRAAR